jgi:hypothetical protein
MNLQRIIELRDNEFMTAADKAVYIMGSSWDQRSDDLVEAYTLYLDERADHLADDYYSGMPKVCPDACEDDAIFDVEVEIFGALLGSVTEEASS